MSRRPKEMNFQIGILTPAMAAEVVGISRQTIIKWMNKGLLPYNVLPDSRDCFINPHHLRELLEKNKAEPSSRLLECCKNHDNYYGANKEEDTNALAEEVAEPSLEALRSIQESKHPGVEQCPQNP